MIFEWLTSTGSFDKLRQGGYDDGSACGFVQECKDVKGCISRVCAPNRDAYGGTFYDSCVTACNGDSGMNSVKDFVCSNPETALQLYGVQCDGYTPTGSLSIFGRNVSVMQIVSIILIFVILYIISKRIG